MSGVEWRQKLYDSYVSSGQAGLSQDDMLAAVNNRRRVLDRMVERHFPADKSVKIVDLGCGFGTALYVAKEHGYKNVEGVDISPEQVEAAHKLGNTEVKQGDLGPYLASLPASSVGVVLILDVLEHLDRQELFDTVSAIARVLKPGGRLIAHIPNAQGIFSANIRYGDLTHELAFTPTSCRQLLTVHGFKQIECFEETPVAHGLKSTLRAIIWAVGSLGPRLLFAAETGQTKPVLTMNMTCVADKA